MHEQIDTDADETRPTQPIRSDPMKLSIPLHPTLTQPAPREAAPTLLVFLRDPGLRIQVKTLLERAYTLIPAADVTALGQTLRTTPVAAVLMDFNAAVVRALRSRYSRADLPILVLSPGAGSAAVVEALDTGANDCLTDMPEPEVFRARVSAQVAIQRRQTAQRQVIQHLRKAYDTKDRCLRIAIHDLKNPLNNLRLASYFLRTTVPDDPATGEALRAIDESILGMSDLITTYLETASLEQGKTELNLEAVDLDTTFWAVMAQHQTVADRKQVTLRLGAIDGTVQADRGRLMQIIGNLVSNAIKYSDPGGMVTLSSQVNGDHARIQVADEGPGIPNDERAVLFEPFSKLSPRPTAGESSTGLGLWIVSELAKLHHGRAGVDCPPSGGSIFWVDLPTAPTPAASAAS
jgi:signal transduction histidine kinase